MWALLQTIIPNIFPTIAPRTSNGKKIPPGVPEPKLTNVKIYFINKNKNNIVIVNLPFPRLIISECPPPNKIGAVIPTTPAHKNGIITLTWIGTFLKIPYISCVLSIPLLNNTPVNPKIIPNIQSVQ